MDAIKAFSNVFPTSDQFIKLVFIPNSRPEVFCKKRVFRNFAKFSGKHLCQTLFFNNVAGLGSGACNFIKKEALAQVFSCEFCEISKNTFFTEHLWWLRLFYITFLICLTAQGITVSISLFWSSKFIFYTFESYFIVNIECVWAPLRIKVTFNNFI